MAGPKAITENYCSQAVIQMTQTTANTIFFEKLETGLSVYDKVGWVLSRVEWRPSAAALAQFNTSGDELVMALTMSNTLTALADNDPAIYAIRHLVRLDIGTAASGSLIPLGYVDDYSTLPGGGILMLPNPIYGSINSAGLAAAVSVNIRIFFQSVQLGDADYFNLVQARQLLINS